jgi:3D (Asp-Asp-Asp) domain-containing protein
VRRGVLALAAVLTLLPAVPTTASQHIVPAFYPWPRPRYHIGAMPVRRVLERIRVVSTSYCLRGLTYTGTRVAHGTIAVDPSVIPLHSRLYVPGYGEGVARDTGSAIVGRRVDVWLPPAHGCAASWAWGRRTLTVEVLGRRMWPTSGMRAALEKGA